MSIFDKFFQSDIQEKRKIIKYYWENINKLNPINNAFISLIDHNLFTNVLQSKIISIPIAYKDNICTKDFLTTCASKMLSNFKPIYDSTVVSRAKKANLICLGKLNMDEFAMGSEGNTSFFGPVIHPLDPTVNPGGSSSGSAVAVAANMAPVTLGSDTGGSCRLPAARCGVYGMKATYGLVSRHGLIPYACSLDQIGVLSKYPKDIAYTLDIIGGLDTNDLTSLELEPGFFCSYMDGSFNGIKIGFDYKIFNIFCEQKRKSAKHIINAFTRLGIQFIDIDIYFVDLAIDIYVLIANAEASINLSRFDGIRFGIGDNLNSQWSDYIEQVRSDGFNSNVKRRIIAGHNVLANNQAFSKANKIRSFIIKEMEKIYNQVDLILTPSQITSCSEPVDILHPYVNDKYNVLANLTGQPAMAFPSLPVSGLPFGFQIQGPRFSDHKILSLIHHLQNEL